MNNPITTPVSTDRLYDSLAEVEEHFPALHLTRSSKFATRLGRQLIVLMFLCVLAAFFVPWQQSIRGEGSIVAFDPFERPQPVQAPVKGLVAKRGEGVIENAYVEAGQTLFVIEDQDPQYLFRLEQQQANAQSDLSATENRLKQAQSLPAINERVVEIAREELSALEAAQSELDSAYEQFVMQAENKLAAQKNKLRASEAKYEQVEADYRRKQDLFQDGLVSELTLQKTEQAFLDAEAKVGESREMLKEAASAVRGKEREQKSKWQEWQAKINKVVAAVQKAEADVRKAQIDINKIAGELAEKRTKLQKSQRDFEAQKTQVVVAPRSGYIMNLTVFDGMPVKQFDTLCRIVPKTDSLAVQVWVAGNDAPLIHQGDHVRLQFEGWPAVQFSGWPSVAVGTFGGTVALVDPTDNGKGKFRVLVKPDADSDKWPDYPYLRQGVRANGWVLLDRVPLGYEVWRRMNGFPPSLIDIEEQSKTAEPPKIKI
jgi:multidrug resistance efflux pump